MTAGGIVQQVAPHVCDISRAGDEAALICPECGEQLPAFTSGCPDCTRFAAVAYAVHLVAEHPAFIVVIKESMA